MSLSERLPSELISYIFTFMDVKQAAKVKNALSNSKSKKRKRKHHYIPKQTFFNSSMVKNLTSQYTKTYFNEWKQKNFQLSVADTISIIKYSLQYILTKPERHEVIDVILEKRCFNVSEFIKSKIVFKMAARFGVLKVLEFFVKNNADIKTLNQKDQNNIDYRISYILYTGIECAIRYGKLEIVKYLIENGAEIIDVDIMEAVQHLDILKYFHRECNQDIIGFPFLLYNAISRKEESLDIIKYIIDAGFDIQPISENSANFLMHSTVKYGNLNILKYFIETLSFIPKDNLLVAACFFRHDCLEMIKYLVELGLNIKTNHNEVVRLAARNGDLSVVQYCIEIMKVDISIVSVLGLRPSYGNSLSEPIVEAARYNRAHVVEYLRKYSPKHLLDDDLFSAINLNEVRRVENLVQFCKKSTIEKALKNVSKRKHSDVVKILNARLKKITDHL